MGRQDFVGSCKVVNVRPGDGSLASQRGDHSAGGAGLAREILRRERAAFAEQDTAAMRDFDPDCRLRVRLGPTAKSAQCPV
jgi:hypothetical protein